MSEAIIRRDDLAQFFSSNPRLLRAFEAQAATVEDISNGVADTSALKDATVVVLSANGDFTNERVLELGEGLDVAITDTHVRISVKDVARARDHGVTFVSPAEVVLFLPAEGLLLSDKILPVAPVFASLGSYANDAAAATAGVPVRGGYINSTTGAVQARLA